MLYNLSGMTTIHWIQFTQILYVNMSDSIDVKMQNCLNHVSGSSDFIQFTRAYLITA